MKQFWLLVLVVVSFNSLGSQEVKHSPTTVDECRADERLWESMKDNETVSFRELSDLGADLFYCMHVDPEWKNVYDLAVGTIDATQLKRLLNFLHRHNLYDQFLAEDAQGKH